MKNLFVSSLIALAAIACALSCNKNNTNESSFDPIDEIKTAVRKASLPVYCLDEAKAGGAGFARVAGMATFVTTMEKGGFKGGEQDKTSGVLAIIAFNEAQLIIPDNLCIRNNEGESVQIENIQMLTSTVAIGRAIRKAFGSNEPLIVLDDVAPDGAPADNYLVDLGKINDLVNGNEQDETVLPIKEVQHNLERHIGECFLNMQIPIRSGEKMRLRGIDQVQECMADGTGSGVAFAPLWRVGYNVLLSI